MEGDRTLAERMTGERSVLRIEGVQTVNLKTGAPDEREAHQ